MRTSQYAVLPGHLEIQMHNASLRLLQVHSGREHDSQTAAAAHSFHNAATQCGKERPPCQPGWPSQPPSPCIHRDGLPVVFACEGDCGVTRAGAQLEGSRGACSSSSSIRNIHVRHTECTCHVQLCSYRCEVHTLTDRLREHHSAATKFIALMQPGSVITQHC
jgi:hypothetical protein